MARVELGEIPNEGLSEKEISEIRRQRICDIVSDKGGELRNPDKLPHPWNNWWICERECSDGQGGLIKCNALFASRHSAEEHQEAHAKNRVGQAYKLLDKADKPTF